ncbi:hypothetical protein NEOKW01_0492 [Nematocida sp. AWRm80]|nr:hypothetical protein NEOKW01_0492 [Nematocida sp. AWRm80]
MHCLTDDEKRERVAKIKEYIGLLSSMPPSVLFKSLSQVYALLPGVSEMELNEEEFILVISVLNQRPSLFLISVVFRILKSVSLTRHQCNFFFDYHKKQKNEKGPYSNVNWSFLDLSVNIKRYLVSFINHLVSNYPVTVFKAAKMLSLLLDDEDKVVRIRSYKYLCGISREHKKEWSSKEKQQFYKPLRYFGKNGLSILKNEALATKNKDSLQSIRITPIKNILRVHIILGRKIRKRSPIITIKGNSTVKIPIVRTHTILYYNEPHLHCTLFLNDSPQLERTYP